MVRRRIRDSRGYERTVNVKHLKAWKQSHEKVNGRFELKPEIRLKRKLTTARREIKPVIPKTEVTEEVEAWELESQHSYSAKSGTDFSYRVGGVFANKPSMGKIEEMVGKSMPASFHNSSRSGKHRRLPRKLYSEMLDGSLKGIRLEKKRLTKDKITNTLWGTFEIKSKGSRWGGENGANKPYFA